MSINRFQPGVDGRERHKLGASFEAACKIQQSQFTGHKVNMRAGHQSPEVLIRLADLRAAMAREVAFRPIRASVVEALGNSGFDEVRVVALGLEHGPNPACR
jgi:hypothetical protein